MGISVPDKLKELVDHFDNNLSQIKSQQYNETQARREFIDPLFTLLGWDVDNKQGYAEAYKDVIHEDAIKVGGFTKAPDYCFRIGGTRKFFVEAKKPGVNIKEDIDPAYQLRRYAWSSKLPLSILTDFEEFAVYDCRTKPNPADKSSVGRVRYVSYTDYINEWDYLISTFSREAVLKGSFDKYVESNKAKKGTTEVDKAFLTEIEAWRDALARNIALRNPSLSTRELNVAVQTTIDRIIFLRICEDRGVEDYAKLMALQNGEGVYSKLMTLFRDADEKYNSGLFHFEPEKGRETHDSLTPSLQIDDKVLKELLKSLYYPDSPYEFSVVPADILGQVYEQFLGKVIRLTAGHQAKVEDKPEVKKAGGVYYTPTYIVDYIVKNTVGKILEGKTTAEVSGETAKADHPVRILDPACGSGSFLLGAYEYLLTWYRDQYIKAGPERYAKGKEPKLFQSQGGGWKLTTAEKKRILLSHIYGVDIDSQAVEVTKLSLLLKVLEGETRETVNTARILFKERALPDLSKNIKCGNSLIGSDFYKDRQLDLFDEEEKYRINAFDWEEEFKEVFKNGGFDAVIGNPPYIRMEEFKESKSYFRSKYQTHSDRADIFYYFIEKATSVIRKDGMFGFIISNTFARSRAGKSLRSFISKSLDVEKLVEFGDFTPFEGATVYPIIIIACKSAKAKTPIAFVLQEQAPSSFENQFQTLFNLERSSIGENEWVFGAPAEQTLRTKLFSQHPTLRHEFGQVGMGIKSGLNEAFIISDEDKKKITGTDPEAKILIKPYVGGKDLDHYSYHWDTKWLIYIPRGTAISRHRSLLAHLQPFKASLEKRAGQQEWYELQQSQEAYASRFDKHKIIFPDMSRYPKFSLDKEGHYFSNTVYFIPSDSLYLLGLLNSKLLWFVIRGLSNALRGGLWRFRLFSGHVERLPIPSIDLFNPKQKSLHDKLVSLVTSMLSLHKQLQAAKTEQDKTIIQRQINATDKEIDRLVYELYELTPEEIKIVEGEK